MVCWETLSSGSNVDVISTCTTKHTNTIQEWFEKHGMEPKNSSDLNQIKHLGNAMEQRPKPSPHKAQRIGCHCPSASYALMPVLRSQMF